MSKILIGVDDSPRSDDAVAFARPLAAAGGASVVLVCAFPYEDFPSRAANAEYRAALMAQAHKTLARAVERLEGIDAARIETAAVASTSPAKALDSVAGRVGAELIVLGSTHTGRLGRVLPGSTAERMLHGAPCPVAVVPSGWRSTGAAPRVIGVAYDGSKESKAALHAATSLAHAFDAELRVIGVLEADRFDAPALMGGPGYGAIRATLEKETREALERTVAELPSDVRAEPVFAAGEVVQELAAQSARLDLMIAGSRGYGPARSVLVGGVTGRLIREAACPLVIVPRGHETPLEALFPAAALSAS
jgi:nucleotide-binding universal stress UspA family protein